MFPYENKEQESVKTLILSLNTLINDFKWLLDAFLSDFFVKNLRVKVKSKWWEILKHLEPEELATLLCDNWNSRQVWPLSLMAYRRAVLSASLNDRNGMDSERKTDVKHSRVETTKDFNPSQYLPLEHCYRKHVKPKKQHEILQLGKAIHELGEVTRCNRVVDVGGGHGHLSRLLAFGFGLETITLDAAGCHNPKAQEFDSEIKRDMLKAKRRLETSENSGSESVTNTKGDHTSPEATTSPHHYTAWIDPSVTTDQFLSIVNHCRNSLDCAGNSVNVETNSNYQKKDTLIDKVSESFSRNTSPRQVAPQDNNVHHVSNVTSLQEKSYTISPCEKCASLRNEKSNASSTEDLKLERRNETENTIKEDALKQCVHKNEPISSSNPSNLNKSAELLELCDMCKNETRNEKAGNSKCLLPTEDYESENSKCLLPTEDYESENSKCLLPTEYYESENPKCLLPTEGHKLENDNKDLSPTKNQDSNISERDDGLLLTGLHACGDLTTTLLRLFVQCPQVKGIAAVGCCYMKLSTHSETSDSTGFPMSSFVKNIPDHQLSYEALEMACHFVNAYCCRLKDKSQLAALKSHCYRAALQEIVHDKDPHFRHGCIKFSVKNLTGMDFKSYAEKGLKRLGLDPGLSPAQIERAEARLKQWRDVVAFYTLRLSLAPLVESFILLDRYLYLQENGISCDLVPIFDPQISPRNVAVIARKL